MSQVNVVCVNWGTKYSIDYVMRLHNMVQKNTSRNFKMFCLTDSPEKYPDPVTPIMLEPGYEGWWNKMQLFRDDVLPVGDYLYFDLDVVIVDNIDCFFEFIGFGITRDFINPDTGLLGGNEYNSSIMRFTQNKSLWSYFEDNQDRWKKEQQRVPFFGDQNVISDYLNNEGYDKPFPDEWIWSFKIGSIRGRRPVDHSKYFGSTIPDGGKICVFHGYPNPEDVDVDWVSECWTLEKPSRQKSKLHSLGQEEIRAPEPNLNEVGSIFAEFSRNWKNNFSHTTSEITEVGPVKLNQFFEKNENLISRLKAIKSMAAFPKPRIAFFGYTDLMLNKYEWIALGIDQDKLINRKNHRKLIEIHARTDVEVVPTIPSVLDELFDGQFELTVFDFKKNEGSEVTFDLNFQIDGKYKDQFDIIVDDGFCARIFNLPQALINVQKMLRVGGIVYHSGPVCRPNHVFYGYNPSLFADFYENNGCGILDLCMEAAYEENMQRKILVVNGVPKYESFQLKNVFADNLEFLQLEYNLTTLIWKIIDRQDIFYPIQRD